MSSLIKYRVRDVAKDFDRTPKEIINILGKYGEAPKNNMQVLEDGELAILFDYLTQNNQVQSIESIFADTYHEPKPAAAPKAAPAPQKGAEKPTGGAVQNGGKPEPVQAAEPYPVQKASPSSSLPRSPLRARPSRTPSAGRSPRRRSWTPGRAAT